MNPGESESKAFWSDLVDRSVDRAPGAGEKLLVFAERRHDLVGAMSCRRDRPEIVLSRSVGLSVSGPGSRSVYRSGLNPRESEQVGGEGSADWPSLSAAGVASWLESLQGETKKLHPGALVDVRMVAFDQCIQVVGPDGARVADRRQGRRVRLEAHLGEGVERTTAVAERLVQADLEADSGAIRAMARDVTQRLASRIRARAASPGKRKVVFSPAVGGILIHEIVGHALEADAYLGGMSWLSGSGAYERVGSEEILVIDDPRRGRAGWKFDDEGQVARATPLIDRGRVVGCLESLDSVSSSGRKTTGHGRRASYRHRVLPRMGCTFLAAGRHRPEEALEGVDDGIYVRRMESASTDPRSGVAVFRVTDSDHIRAGRIEAPLQPLMLRVHARHALSSLDRVGHDLAFDRCMGSCVRDGQPLVTSVGAPTFRIGETTVFC